MRYRPHNRVVHLELHRCDPAGARSFLRQLLGWQSQAVGTGNGSYVALSVGGWIGGGIVECGHQPASWLPYVGVGDVRLATEHASQLGASVVLAPREGPGGWRSVVTAPGSGDLALWQPKGRWQR